MSLELYLSIVAAAAVGVTLFTLHFERREIVRDVEASIENDIPAERMEEVESRVNSLLEVMSPPGNIAASFRRSFAYCPAHRAKSEEELFADYIAAALLMPIEDVYTFLQNHSYRSAPPKVRVKLVNELSKIYGVDPLVAFRRVRQVYAVKDLQHELNQPLS